MADNPTNALTNNEVVKQGNNEYRRTVQHLPAFYRTDTNQRFLSSTLDPLVQKGTLERLDGYIGRQDAYTRESTTDTSQLPAGTGWHTNWNLLSHTQTETLHR